MIENKEKTDLVEDWVAAMPQIYYRLREAIDDPASTFKEIGTIVSGDMALSARLLKIVNSPFFGFSTEVETIQHALSIIGTEQLSELILTTSVMASFREVPKDLVNISDFWKSSVTCGVAARRIAKYQDSRNSERHYLIGMLHNIGSLVLFKKMPVGSSKIFKHCRENEANLFEMEKKNLGFSHADVGALLLRKWLLPKSIVIPVNFHHNPLQAPDFKKETCVLHVANALSYQYDTGMSGEPSAPELNPEALDILDLTKNTLGEILDGLG